MTRASLVSALALSLGLLSFGCGNKEETPATTDFKTVQGLMVTGGCTLAPCHGSGAPATTKLKVTAADKANCDGVVLASNGLVDKTTPANSKLVTYPGDSKHTGGNMIAGWKSPTDTAAAQVVAWIKGGAACP